MQLENPQSDGSPAGASVEYKTSAPRPRELSKTADALMVAPLPGAGATIVCDFPVRMSTAIHRGFPASSGQNSAAASPPAEVPEGSSALVAQSVTGASPAPTRAPCIVACSDHVTMRPNTNAVEVADVESVRTESVSHW